MIITLREGKNYTATLDGMEIPVIHRTNGAIEISLSGEIKSGIVKVFAK